MGGCLRSPSRPAWRCSRCRRAAPSPPLGAPTSTGVFGPSTLSFSPTGGLLAAAAPNNMVMVFTVSDAGDLDLVEPATVLDDFSSAVAFSPERAGCSPPPASSTCGCSGRRTAGVLTAVGSPTPFSYDPVSPVAFSPDGTLLVAANWSYSTLSVHPLAAPRLDVAITSAPAAMTSSTTAAFEFEANYPSTLECRLDAASFAPCATPESHAFAGLAEGPHTFAVRAHGSAGQRRAVTGIAFVDRRCHRAARSGACAAGERGRPSARCAAVRVVADDRQPDRRRSL